MHIRLNKGASLKCLAFVVCAVVSGLSQGCGPITAHSTIAKAHIAIEAAEGARAQELAVFEYESAKLYLTKAKLEEGLSSFQSAIDLAEASRDFADSARARALKNAQARPLTPTERRRQLINRQPNRGRVQSAQPSLNSPVAPPMPTVPRQALPVSPKGR